MLNFFSVLITASICYSLFINWTKKKDKKFYKNVIEVSCKEKNIQLLVDRSARALSGITD